MSARPRVEPHYPPALYDAVHRGNPGDAAFYVRACAGAHRVLELGCGTGRVARELVGAGLDVVGVDVNRTALVRAAARGVAAVAADIRCFAFRSAFERIVAPYNTLYCLLDETDLLSCLRCVRAHLAPDGLLVFDGYAMDEWHRDADPAAATFAPGEPVDRVLVDGERYDVIESTRWDPARQRADTTYRHVAAGDTPAIEVDLPQRYLLGEQLPGLLASAGLELRALHGDFEEGPFAPDSEHLVVRAGAAG